MGEGEMKFSVDNPNVIFDATFKYAKKLARDFYFNVWVKNPLKMSGIQRRDY